MAPPPISTSSVVLARVAVSLIIATMQTAIFLGIGMAFFGLKLTDSVSKTEEGAIGLANFVVLQMAFLSGSFFPPDGALTGLQAVGSVLPLKHLNDGMLNTMVRGERQGNAA